MFYPCLIFSSLLHLKALFNINIILLFVIYIIHLPVVRPQSCRVIYYFDTLALGIRHQLFDRVSNHHQSTEKHTFYKDQLFSSNVYILFSSMNSTTSCPRSVIIIFLDSWLIGLTLSSEWMWSYRSPNRARFDWNERCALYQLQVFFNDNDVRVAPTKSQKWVTQSSMVVILISQDH